MACDISPEMLNIARRKFRDHADAFFLADMRALPPVGDFDLVVCLDDCVNYLLSDADLQSAFGSVAALLAPEGIFAFDVNTLLTYRSGFGSSMVRESDGLVFIWRGGAAPKLRPCDRAEATVEVFAERPDGLWERSSTRHIQRHHSSDAIVAALEAVGLCCRRMLGQLPGARLEKDGAEDRHSKLLYFASPARPIRPHGPAGTLR
jgi:SAM-dependent methyltransferase